MPSGLRPRRLRRPALGGRGHAVGAEEGETKKGFAYVDKRLNAGFERTNNRIDRIYYAIIVGSIGMIGALLANGIWG
jgi:hypothetical protein